VSLGWHQPRIAGCTDRGHRVSIQLDGIPPDGLRVGTRSGADFTIGRDAGTDASATATAGDTATATATAGAGDTATSKLKVHLCRRRVLHDHDDRHVFCLEGQPRRATAAVHHIEEDPGVRPDPVLSRAVHDQVRTDVGEGQISHAQFQHSATIIDPLRPKHDPGTASPTPTNSPPVPFQGFLLRGGGR
jgi:hypothetical protein